MAPSGPKLGKLVHPACQHAPNAKAFLTSHLCWQDRVAKERGADYSVSLRASEERKPPPQKSMSLTNLSALQLARHEYHPIGGNSMHNNNSGQISTTLGPRTWKASGGLKSEYSSQVGNPTLPAFGSPPPPFSDTSASYLPKAIRAEGQRKARADQIEAIPQHGEGTILMLQRGDMQASSPAEEQVFRGGGSAAPPSAGQGRASSTGRSRLSNESWGSAQSNAASECRRIHELGDKARLIGSKNAKAHQKEAMRQHGEGTIIANASRLSGA